MNNNISWLVFIFIQMFRKSFILLWLKKEYMRARVATAYVRSNNYNCGKCGILNLCHVSHRNPLMTRYLQQGLRNAGWKEDDKAFKMCPQYENKVVTGHVPL